MESAMEAILVIRYDHSFILLGFRVFFCFSFTVLTCTSTSKVAIYLESQAAHNK